MTSLAIAPSRSQADQETALWRIGAITVLVMGLSFNAALAYVNAGIFPLNSGHVTIVQGAVLLSAFAVGLTAPKQDLFLWLGILWCMALWWMLFALLRHAPNPKYLGDIGAFPVFALLGALLRPRDFVNPLVALQAVILGVGIWEAIDPAAYGSLFNVESYYVDTRGYDPTNFFGENNLFLNAERPGGRLFLPQLDIHRVSSIFLEPVSLGNWTALMTIMIISLWSRFAPWQRGFLIASNVALLVLCDGRFAAIGSIGIILTALTARHMPRAVGLLLPFVMLGALFTALSLEAIDTGGDTLSGRLAKSVSYFREMSLTDLMGMTPEAPGYTFDSGWTYLAITQSIFGFVGYWLLIGLVLPIRNINAKRFLLMTLVFFALSMPVSNSFISIKSSAFLFALYGCFLAMTRDKSLPGNAAGRDGASFAPPRSKRA